MVSECLSRRDDGLVSAWGWMALAVGIASGIATAILGRFSLLWSGLIVVALAVLVCSLMARDSKAYWLVIFALVLPLEIKKMLVDSAFVMEFVKQYGFPTGELPGPVLCLSDLPLLMLFFLWSIDILLHRQPVRFPKAHWLALALLGWSALSILNARDLASAFYDLCRGVKFYLLYIFAYNVLGERHRVRLLVIALLVGVAVQGVLCVAQFASQDVGRLFSSLLGKKDMYSANFENTLQGFLRISEEGLAGKRGSGTVGAINAEALYFELLLPMAFLIGLTVRRSVERSWAILASVLGLLGLVVTFSRGGVTGLFCGTVALLVLAWLRNAMPRRQIILVGLSMLLVLTAALPLVTRFFVTRPESSTSRIYLLQVGLQMVRDHPWLGVGLNNHLQAKIDYDPRRYSFQMPTHNHYVLLASQIGIPGLALFLGFFWSAWHSALKAAWSNDPLLVAVAVGTAATLVAVVVHCLFDIIGTHANLSLLWLSAGMAAALEARVRAPTCGLLLNAAPPPKPANG